MAGSSAAAAAPLILTLRLDDASQSRFEAERRAHFPPERNLIPAHLTLFHALPGEAEAEIAANLATLAGGTAPFPVAVSGLRPLGRGVAYTVDSPRLSALRGMLATQWYRWLTPQDRQSYRPHVTVQNKVEPTEARALLATLQARFTPWEATAEALLLWRYRGGPWESAAEFRFRPG
jgi:2'-5' RNA ligase